MHADAPADGTAGGAGAEEFSDVTGAKLAAQSDQDTEAIELLKTVCDDGATTGTSTSAPGGSVGNTEGGHAPADGNDTDDGSSQEDPPQKKV